MQGVYRVFTLGFLGSMLVCNELHNSAEMRSRDRIQIQAEYAKVKYFFDSASNLLGFVQLTLTRMRQNEVPIIDAYCSAELARY